VGDVENSGRASSRNEKAGKAEVSANPNPLGRVGDGGCANSAAGSSDVKSTEGGSLAETGFVCAKLVMGFARGEGSDREASGSPKRGRASWRKAKGAVLVGDSDATAEAIAPGTAGAAWMGNVTGATDAGPALAGNPGRCGSPGKDTSGRDAGIVEGGELRAAVSLGAAEPA
jgi:hypothetical protein